jgi:prepilin-type N-terminal cleavage/methylation domain-containing protein
MKRSKGFTLIELLVVMAIIATLMTIAMPRYFNSLESSREATLRQSLAVLREPWTTTTATPATTPTRWSNWWSSATCATPGRPDHRTQRRLAAGAAARRRGGRRGRYQERCHREGA